MAAWKIETRKRYGTYDWVNTWALDHDTLAGAVNCAGIIAAFEAAILLTSVTIMEAKVSAWPNPGGQTFVIVPMALPGARTPASPEPADMCLLAKINATVGHPGKKWFRMCLNEGEVAELNGDAIIVGLAPVITAFQAAALDLDADLTAAGGVLLIGSEAVSARSSTNALSIAGVGFRDRDVGWYNRTP